MYVTSINFEAILTNGQTVSKSFTVPKRLSDKCLINAINKQADIQEILSFESVETKV